MSNVGNKEGSRAGLTCEEASASPAIIVIFGASGDLALRKLLPALFHLKLRGLLDPATWIVGCARSPMDDDAFRAKVEEKLRPLAPEPSVLTSFLQSLRYAVVNYDNAPDYAALGSLLDGIESASGGIIEGRVYFLSTPYTVYEQIIRRLGEAGLVSEAFDAKPWRRVVIEKPFGSDLRSAREMEKGVGSVLRERQIYRIDHYLGKETVQNIMMLRFANTIFEPIWNNHYIDNVQITVAESIGIEGRAGYYEQSGLLRDMFQNHMFQMLAVVAMEPPSSFDPNLVRNEKVKLLNAVRPIPTIDLERHVIRAQYGKGRPGGSGMPAYREEPGVAAGSRVETFVSARLLVDNWRWYGVPFYLRSGKRMPRRTSDISITFKKIPHSIFAQPGVEPPPPDVLTLNVQPDEGISLAIQAKRPGSKLCMGTLTMDFKYADVFGGASPDAYERLLLDALLGDQTLFIRSDSIDVSWRLLTPILEKWRELDENSKSLDSLRSYSPGSWGPPESDELLEQDGFVWHLR